MFRLGELGGDGRRFHAFCQHQEGLADAIRFGAAVGALAVTRKGAFAAMPSLTEVNQLLREQHHDSAARALREG
ncbi:hypothetical protein FQZ97_1024710 [compost metagenome]